MTRPPFKADHEEPVKRLYFGIDEMARALQVSKSCLRFWEDEFKIQVKHRRGIRYYSADNVGQFALIARLVQFLKITAARSILEKGRSEEILKLLEGATPKKVIQRRVGIKFQPEKW